jgi:two-component system response regulator AtoC
VQRLGALKGTPIDVRIVAATNRNLEEEVKLGKFREDLYYRINVIRIRLPALRERREDVPSLASVFLSRFSADMGRKIRGIRLEAMELLAKHDFPGNVRELENAIERACILTDSDMLEPKDFDFIVDARADTGTNTHTETYGDGIPRTLQEMEKTSIIAALNRNEYHREKTAQELGITRRTLLNKMKEYNLEDR